MRAKQPRADLPVVAGITSVGSRAVTLRILSAPLPATPHHRRRSMTGADRIESLALHARLLCPVRLIHGVFLLPPALRRAVQLGNETRFDQSQKRATQLPVEAAGSRGSVTRNDPARVFAACCRRCDPGTDNSGDRSDDHRPATRQHPACLTSPSRGVPEPDRMRA